MCFGKFHFYPAWDLQVPENLESIHETAAFSGVALPIFQSIFKNRKQTLGKKFINQFCDYTDCQTARYRAQRSTTRWM